MVIKDFHFYRIEFPSAALLLFLIFTPSLFAWWMISKCSPMAAIVVYKYNPRTTNINFVCMNEAPVRRRRQQQQRCCCCESRSAPFVLCTTRTVHTNTRFHTTTISVLRMQLFDETWYVQRNAKLTTNEQKKKKQQNSKRSQQHF